MNDRHLFMGGNIMMGGDGGLTTVLENHERSIIHRINSVNNINDLDDALIESLIKDAVIPPLVLDYDNKTQFITEVQRGFSTSGPLTAKVVTVCIPFTGDVKVFGLCPSRWSTSNPRGHIVGKELRFTVDLSSESSKGIESNIINLKEYVTNANEDIKKFNLSLPDKAKQALERKYDKLLKEAEMLDAIGIPTKIEPAPKLEKALLSIDKPQRRTVPQFVVYIDKVITNELTQNNYNQGDVQNAIQPQPK